MANHLIIVRFFFCKTKNNKLQEGSIGHDMVIKPVPYGLIKSENPENDRSHHIIYRRKVNDDESDQFSDFGEYRTNVW